MIPDGAALARDAFRSSPAVRSRVPAATAPLCLLPPLVPARRTRPAASSGPDVPLDGRFDRVVSSRGTGQGGAGRRGPGLSALSGGRRVFENRLYVAYELRAHETCALRDREEARIVVGHHRPSCLKRLTVSSLRELGPALDKGPRRLHGFPTWPAPTGGRRGPRDNRCRRRARRGQAAYCAPTKNPRE
jgi:hypothetical protein